MANPNKAFFTGADQVLNWFDANAKKPYWSIMDAKNNIIYQFTENDMHDSRQSLEDNLLAAQAAGISATLTLRLHPKQPKDGYFGKGTEVMQVTYFRPVEFEVMPYNPNAQMMGGANVSAQLSALESKINALQMQLAEKEMEEDDEDEEEDSMGFLSGLMGNPAVKQMVMSAISNLIAPQQQTSVTHVAGISTETTQTETEMENEFNDQDAKIDEAIERLLVHDPVLGDDLLKLCEIAENDPKQFAMLLKMLRM